MTPPFSSAIVTKINENMMKFIIIALLIFSLLVSVKLLGKNNKIEEAIEDVIEEEFNIDVDFHEK